MDNKVLAIVNGREIKESDLVMALAKFPPERRSQLASEDGKKYLLEQVIAWELLYMHAKDENLEERDEYKLQIEEAKKGILSQIAVNDVISNVKVSDEELEEYYNSNTEAFSEDAKIKANHILVDSEELANSIVSEMKNGLSFKDAAEKYSTCPSKAQGGSLGAFGRGMMVPEFEDAAFELELGKISDPVKTQFGYHIILVEEKIPQRVKSLEEVKPQIMSSLLQGKQSQSYIDLVEDLKKKYNLEMK